jgi:hypothetical protein
MRRLRQTLRPLRSRPGLAAIISLGVAWGLVMHTMGWAQLAHYSQVRAFADGRADIDRWHWETNDKAWVDGHFYSVKSPGVAALSLPFYLAIDGLGGKDLAGDAVANAERTAHPKWHTQGVVPLENYAFDVQRGIRVEAQVERETPIVWALTLIVAVIPATLLLVGVRWAGDRIEPGFGTAAAITLGLATIVMTFAAEYFSHVISAALAFAAFLVLMKERDGPSRTPLVAAAGLLAGLAVTFEFQTGLAGIVLFAYALVRPRQTGRPDETGRTWRSALSLRPRIHVRRAAAYAGGAVLGALPMLAFNAWAFGNPLKLAYGDAVDFPGMTGHDVLGLNSHGFFGITAPRPGSALDLLLAGRGLLVLTPVIVMCVVGALLMRRRGPRAEANVILAMAAVYFLYNAGYWLPFGGGTPGPRFLMPALPFLALGLATAYRRLPALTLGLAIPSALFMVSATLTYPLLGRQGTGTWADWLLQGNLEHTVFTAFGVTNAWLAATPFVAAVLTAAVLAVRATPSISLSDFRFAVPALFLWAFVSATGPSVAAYEISPLDRGNSSALWLIGAGLILSVGILTVARARERRGEARAERSTRPQPGLAEPVPPEAALTPGLALDEPTS